LERVPGPDCRGKAKELRKEWRRLKRTASNEPEVSIVALQLGDVALKGGNILDPDAPEGTILEELPCETSITKKCSELKTPKILKGRAFRTR